MGNGKVQVNDGEVDVDEGEGRAPETQATGTAMGTAVNNVQGRVTSWAVIGRPERGAGLCQCTSKQQIVMAYAEAMLCMCD